MTAGKDTKRQWCAGPFENMGDACTAANEWLISIMPEEQ